ncbi:ovalbumin-related protein X-like isoform X2 [Venturia canescens]|uniref:ovalbumin-related protein X-like isoform X2 n=1 Tax=Venturia canescens TaxID=32260 RepID=UPI001C9C4FC2|nr:ovalbumin-related protein X-like isoform X2 [Venturia canescens]
MRFLLLITAVVWHVSSSDAMAVQPNQSEALRAVTQSANTFSPNFFKKVAEEKKGNLICSPLSASMVLSMVAYGARGNTEKQMRSVLALPEKDEVAKSGFQAFIDSFKNYKQVELRLANKIFLAEGFTPKAEYNEMTKTGFRSEAQKVNFGKAAEASKTINDWCEAQTNNRIKDLISPNDLDPMTAMVLVNAVYFKGNWAEKFDVANTKPRPFNVDATTKKDVPTMFRSGSYNYGVLEDVKAKFVEIPYKSEGANDAMSMFVVLPDAVDGLAELEKNIEKVTVEKLLSGSRRDVNLYLPKFKIESEIPLNSVLQKMGMTDMFTDSANFSGISDASLAVSKVLQKAFIEVNEEGSEAAAATGIIAVPTSLIIMPPPKPIEFNVDHPSMFIIATNDAVLFIAALDQPSTSGK